MTDFGRIGKSSQAILSNINKHIEWSMNKAQENAEKRVEAALKSKEVAAETFKEKGKFVDTEV